MPIAALEAATDLANLDATTDRAIESVHSAAEAIAEQSDGRRLSHELRSDLELLNRASSQRHISDYSPLPPHFFAVYQDSAGLVLQAVRDLSNELASLVARDPRALDRIEWRDLERMLALVFERLGFANTCKRRALYFLNKRINPSQHHPVCLLPIQIVFPCVR